MKAVNNDPKPDELTTNMDIDPLPAALESFVANLGASLSAEQKSQLHGLLKRPNSSLEDLPSAGKQKAPAQVHHQDRAGNLPCTGQFQSHWMILTGDMTLIMTFLLSEHWMFLSTMVHSYRDLHGFKELQGTCDPIP